MPEYEDPFDDPNRPPLPEVENTSGFDHRMREGESDEEYGRRYRDFLRDNASPSQDPEQVVRPFGFGQSPDVASGGETFQMLAEDLRRIRELLEGILNA